MKKSYFRKIVRSAILGMLAIVGVSAQADVGKDLAELQFRVLAKMAEIRNRELTCDYETYSSELVKVASKIMNLDGATYKPLMKGNRTIRRAIGSDIAFRYVLGDFDNYSLDEKTVEAFTRAVVYTGGRGAYGSESYELLNEGKLRYTYLVETEAGELKRATKEGKWRLTSNQTYRIVLEVEVDGKTRSYGVDVSEASSEGWIHFEPLFDGATVYDRLFSFPSECDA